MILNKKIILLAIILVVAVHFVYAQGHPLYPPETAVPSSGGLHQPEPTTVQSDESFVASANNIRANPQRAETYFSKVANGAAINIRDLISSTGTSSPSPISVESAGGVTYLRNGNTRIALQNFKTGDDVKALPNDAFLVNGVLVGGKTGNKNDIGKDKDGKLSLTNTKTTERALLEVPAGDKSKSKIVFTKDGIVVEGMKGSYSGRGGNYQFDATGKLSIENEGNTIRSQGAKVYDTGRFRLYDGSFEKKGDDTSLFFLNGKQSSFVQFNPNGKDLAISTAGYNVVVHSEYLPGDAGHTDGGKTTPLTPAEIDKRAEAAKANPPPKPPNFGGEIWYKTMGNDYIITSNGYVSFKAGKADNSMSLKSQGKISSPALAYAYQSAGAEASFYRGPDPNRQNVFLTTSLGRFKFETYNDKGVRELKADTTVYGNGENPQLIKMSLVSTPTANAMTVDGPGNSKKFMHLDVDAKFFNGNKDTNKDKAVSMDLSKTGDKLNVKLSGETLGAFGDAANKGWNIVPGGGKDFLLSDVKGTVYLGLNSQGLLLENSVATQIKGLEGSQGKYVNILGPDRMRQLLGGDASSVSSQQKTAIMGLSSNSRDGLLSAVRSLSPDTKAKLLKNAAGTEDAKVYQKLFDAQQILENCKTPNNCKAAEDLIKLYANYNDQNSKDSASVNAKQAYFDLFVAASAKPDTKIAADLLNSYIVNNQKGEYFGKADTILQKMKKFNDQDFNNYAAGKLELARYNLLRPENKVLFADESYAQMISYFAKVKPDSPFYGESQDIKKQVTIASLSMIQQNAKNQITENRQKFEETYGQAAGFTTAGTNLINFQTRTDLITWMNSNLNSQAWAMGVFMNLYTKRGMSIDDIQSALSDPTRRRELVAELFPATKDQQTLDMLGSKLVTNGVANPAFQALRRLGKGEDPQNVITNVGPQFWDVVEALVKPNMPEAMPTKTTFFNMPFVQGAELLKLTSGEYAAGAAIQIAVGFGAENLASAALTGVSRIGFESAALTAGQNLLTRAYTGIGAKLFEFTASQAECLFIGTCIGNLPAAKSILTKASWEGRTFIKDGVTYTIKSVDQKTGQIAAESAGKPLQTSIKELAEGSLSKKITIQDSNLVQSIEALQKDAETKAKKDAETVLQGSNKAIADEFAEAKRVKGDMKALVEKNPSIKYDADKGTIEIDAATLSQLKEKDPNVVKDWSHVPCG